MQLDNICIDDNCISVTHISENEEDYISYFRPISAPGLYGLCRDCLSISVFRSHCNIYTIIYYLDTDGLSCSKDYVCLSINEFNFFLSEYCINNIVDQREICWKKVGF